MFYSCTICTEHYPYNIIIFIDSLNHFSSYHSIGYLKDNLFLKRHDYKEVVSKDSFYLISYKRYPDRKLNYIIFTFNRFCNLPLLIGITFSFKTEKEFELFCKKKWFKKNNTIDTAYSNSFFFLKSGTGNLAIERFPSNVSSLFENKDSLLYTMHYRRMNPNMFNFEMWKNSKPINIDSFFKN